ncbi:MAG: glycerophosphodiester phosphodiesterase family protein [Porticoccus sp.]|nr:glycerophosphodiester phosphodiesterase family protein [Porticoccus sp.]
MLVYGHRGAGGEAPENTIAACQHAIERGTRYLELDMRLSKDDQLVMIHDESVDRTTDNTGKVNTYSVAELKKMDARRSGAPWPNKRNTGIVTLDAMLDATPEIKGYQLEVKTGSTAQMERMAELLAEKFPTDESVERIVITSASLTLLQRLMTLAPHIPRGFISITPNPFPVLDRFRCSLLAMNWSVCNIINLGHARRKGIHVSVWTVNDASVIKNLYRSKVDSVITDFPSMALPMIASLER